MTKHDEMGTLHSWIVLILSASIRVSPRPILPQLPVNGTGIARLELLHAELTEQVIGEFYRVFDALGHGFLESIYEEAMVIALRDPGLRVDRQLPVTVTFRRRAIGTFKADLVVESSVVLELKASRAIAPAHEAQLLDYLRATRFEVGLVLNFGNRPRFRRFVFANERKPSTESPRC